MSYMGMQLACYAASHMKNYPRTGTKPKTSEQENTNEYFDNQNMERKYLFHVFEDHAPSAIQSLDSSVILSCDHISNLKWSFNQVHFTAAASAVFLLLALVRAYYLHGSSIKVKRNSLGALKLVTTTILLGLKIAILILISIHHATPTWLISASLAVAEILAICYLSHQEHKRSIRPSALLIIYLLVSIFCEAAHIRVFTSKDIITTATALYAAALGMKILLLILESTSKASFLRPPFNQLSPESTAGIFNQLLFWWVNPVLMQGYQNILVIEDLPNLNDALGTAHVRDAMQQSWDTRPQPDNKWTLLLTILRCLRWPLSAVIIPHLCLIGFKFSSPSLISSAIRYVNEPATEISDQNTGQVLIIAAILIYTGIALCTASYKYLLNRVSTMLRGGMVSLIYNHSLLLQDGKTVDSAPVTLMSTDVDTVADAITNVHEIWGQVVEVVIGFSLLTVKLGWASLVPFVIVLISYKITGPVATEIRARQKVYMAATQKRVAMTSSMLGTIKVLKMMGLSDTVQDSLQSQRLLEIQLQKRFRWVFVALNLIGNGVPIITPAATFIVYAIVATIRGSDPLDTNLAFTSMAIISLASLPAARLITIVPGLAAALACLDRIQTFLLDPSRDDERFVVEKSQGPNKAIYRDDSSSPSQEPLIDIEPSLSIDQFTVKPSPEAQAALVDINIEVESSTVTMIAGPVGSGKTTLLKAILGELPFTGNITISTGHIAYCAQTPWMQNGSIRQNITGFSNALEIDEHWFRTVAHACALDEDMSLLPDGADTLIGSRGVTLSGGQKHRVALARAVYQRFEIVLLDDVLSALDSNTEAQVVSRLLTPTGLFRKLGTTIVLATHSTHHFHLADQIVVLGSGGRVAERGTYDALRSEEGYIGSLLLESAKTSEQSSPPQTDAITKTLQSSTPPVFVDQTRKTGDMAVYAYWFKNTNPWNIVSFLLSAACYSGFKSFSQFWLKWWAEDGTHMGRYASVYATLSIVTLLFESITIAWVLLRIGPQVSEKLHHTLLGVVMRAPISFFATVDTGVTLSRFSQDMNLIDRILPGSAMNIGIRVFRLIAQGFLLFSAQAYMTTTIPVCIIAVYILQRVYLSTSRQVRLLGLESRAPLYSQFMETLEGLATIRAFGWEHRLVATNTERLDVSQRPYYLMFCIQRWLNLVLDLLVAGLAVLVITLAVKLRSTTTGGQVGIALNAVMNFNQLLLRLVENWTQVETSLGAISRLKNFEIEVVSEDKPEENVIPPESWPESGAIEFRNVCASYGSSILALRDVSMKILPGQKVGICGRTGSGKSSLLSTLLRFLDLDSGTIIIDGYDTRFVPRNLIRTRLTAIPQDPFIMNSSIRANIDHSLLIPDTQLIATLEKVDLWSVIEARGGLDAVATAQPLSQGQQQLFCLARAMLSKTSILILDEATSSVDMETEKKIRKVVEEEFQGRTVITVAHRIEAILDGDIVAVLDAGQLVEFGSPEALLQNKGPFWALKTGGMS
ncbi:putative multidrug resistance protein [Mollisia scopiformis]|uniref:Putative multidrug resistance protein n=1 Tax=Mollisia scopiformis TaxID=149040 RepID=A0A194X0F0_MOLSC|nr:putative multidrug resistance protein [Mollisia scopiformis]KUJ13347.1 putative multidrug resistance protein [Mollisia scopiformis]